MTLLSMCQGVARAVNAPAPSTIINNTDMNATALLASAQEEGRQLSRGIVPGLGGRHIWQALRKEAIITTANGDPDYTLPTDFALFVPDTWWDRTNHRPLYLYNPQEWQQVKSGITGNISVFRSIIMRGNQILVDPTPASVDTLAYEYVSKNWCQSSIAVGQSAWAADSDTGILDENLMGLGVKWRYLRQMRAPYMDEKAEWQQEIKAAMAADGGSSKLRSKRRYFEIPMFTVPETGIGQ